MISPHRDPSFAEHPVHGVDGQRRLFNAAMMRCSKARTALDVGAHIGLWTQMLARRFAEVWAFEPVAENFECLKQNASFKHVSLLNVALGEFVGACDMALPQRANSGCWHMTPGKSTTVAALDFFLDQIFDVDLIKIDVEGSEGLVVAGALEIIRRDRPVIVLENNGLGVARYGAAWKDPGALLLAEGYQLDRRAGKDEIWTC